MLLIHQNALVSVGNLHEVVLGKSARLHDEIARLAATQVYQLKAGAGGVQSIH